MEISEQFYSVQGEGISQGVPAYFIRLQGCNLICGGHNGELVRTEKATWHCDTEDVWRKGKNHSNECLIKSMADTEKLEDILQGNVHIVWTGGEPLMQRNIKDIDNFLSYLEKNHPDSGAYNEVETNGTLPLEGYIELFQQINCSPKLANSGMPKNRRIVPVAIQSILKHSNSWFKFVVSREEDIEEMERDYIDPFNIPKSKVILMPACDTLLNLASATRDAYEMTKKYGYRTISRGHILAWNRRTGI
tara:strand:- start:298 stop:1041 length:744 start_codon:yes stop_codon:yes gene_type:complete